MGMHTSGKSSLRIPATVVVAFSPNTAYTSPKSGHEQRGLKIGKSHENGVAINHMPNIEN